MVVMPRGSSGELLFADSEVSDLGTEELFFREGGYFFCPSRMALASWMNFSGGIGDTMVSRVGEEDFTGRI